MEIIDNRYELIEKLGRGGMGIVWRARDRLTDTYIALKQVLARQDALHLSIMEGSIGDFRFALAQEFRVLASLRHPNIISVLDYGFDAEQSPYFTMELLNNPQTIVQAAEDLDEVGKVGLLIELLQALVYLHRHHVIHRDIKPDNILVIDGRVRVLDFGLSVAKQDDIATDKVVGTMGYIAPEVLKGTPPTEQSDLYSVGIIAYQLFAEMMPFNPHDLRAIVNTLPDMDPVSASADLQLAIAQLLEKDPYDRYLNAQETITAFREAINQDAVNEGQAIRESFLQSALFIGRDNEMAQLTDALQALVLKREGSGWLIAGESGVGKSRLLDELRVRALVENILVLYGRAEKDDSQNYSLWREPLQKLILHLNVHEHEASVLRDIIPAIDEFVDYDVPEAPEVSTMAYQKRLLITLSQIVERYERPLLLILEDLHWVQTGGLEFVRRILRLIDKTPLMVIGTYRDDESPYLYGQLSKMKLMPLQRFTTDELEALSVAMLGQRGRNPELIELLEQQTEGNAFFAVEIVRALAEHVGSLSDVGSQSLPEEIFTHGIFNFALRRLNQLPLDYQPMLRLAAVIGREIDFQLMEYVDDEMDYADWLLTCYDASLLDVEENTWRFAHDKLREGILQSLDPKQRPTLNELAAEAIEDVYGDDPEWSLNLLEHWRIAGNIPKTIFYTGIAANQMQLNGKSRDAARILQKGVRMLKAEDSPKTKPFHAPMLNQLAGLYWVMSDYDLAAQRYEQAYEIGTKIGDMASQATALTGLANVTRFKGDYAKSIEQASTAIALWHQSGDPAGLARSIYVLGTVYRHQGLYQDALDYLNEAQKLNLKNDDILDAALLDNQMFLCYMAMGDFDKARATVGSMAVMQEDLENELISAFHLRNQGLLAQANSDFSDARKFFNRSMDQFEQLGNRLGVGVSLSYLGELSIMMEQYSTARSYLSNAIVILRDINAIPYAAMAYSQIARLWLLWDDPENAQDAIADGLTLISEAPSKPTTLHLILTAALWSMERGAIDKTLQRLAIVLEHDEQPVGERELAQVLLSQHLNKVGKVAAKRLVGQGATSIDDIVSDILLECAELY